MPRCVRLDGQGVTRIALVPDTPCVFFNHRRNGRARSPLPRWRRLMRTPAVARTRLVPLRPRPLAFRPALGTDKAFPLVRCLLAHIPPRRKLPDQINPTFDVVSSFPWQSSGGGPHCRTGGGGAAPGRKSHSSRVARAHGRRGGRPKGTVVLPSTVDSIL